MNKSKSIILTLVLVSIILVATVVFSEPGSEKDPLVSLSYLEKRIDQLKFYVDESLSKNSNGSTNNTSNNLEVVEIRSGQSIIAAGGTEIILRAGRASIIGGELGGISDVTNGKDLDTDKPVPLNHLLIVPRNDGRGAYAITDAIFLVRGEYRIR